MLKKAIRNIILKCTAYLFNNRDSKVLFYHDVHCGAQYTEMSTTLKKFQKHIAAIHLLNFEIVADISKKTGQVKIQFDDGFKGVYDCIDFIKKHKIPIEIFIVTSWIGKEGYLSEKEMKELQASNLIRFSSHTHTHPNLGEINENEIRDELSTSKQFLESITGEEVKSLCFPKGSFSNPVIEIAEELGYKEQYSSLPGSSHDLFQGKVVRRNLLQFASVSEVKSVLKGGHMIFNRKYLSRQFKR